MVSFDPKKNSNIFGRFFSNPADSYLLKLPRPKRKFGIKTTREYYKEIRNKYEDFVLHNVDITSVEKILKNLNVGTVSGINQISTRFLKDGAPVIAIYVANIIDMSIKLDTILSQCKIARIKPLFKKSIKTGAKNYRPISLLPLISKAMENPFTIKQKISFKEMNCFTVTIQVSEQISPQIHVCFN